MTLPRRTSTAVSDCGFISNHSRATVLSSSTFPMRLRISCLLQNSPPGRSVGDLMMPDLMDAVSRDKAATASNSVGDDETRKQSVCSFPTRAWESWIVITLTRTKRHM